MEVLLTFGVENFALHSDFGHHILSSVLRVNAEPIVKPPQVCLQCPGVRRRAAKKEEMGCTSAKQVSAVPNGEEAQNKSYSNGDLLSGQCTSILSFITI